MKKARELVDSTGLFKLTGKCARRGYQTADVAIGAKNGSPVKKNFDGVFLWMTKTLRSSA